MKKNARSYFILGALIAFLLILPLSKVKKIRSGMITLFSPLNHYLFSKKADEREMQLHALSLENNRLRVQNEILKEMVSSEDALHEKEMIFANVIFREPASWSSVVWVNAGQNKGIKEKSPVLIGSALIGMIDYVGNKKSRVRLLTDSSLPLSVRAKRDGVYLSKGELYGSNQPLWRSRGQKLKGVGFNYDYADEKGPAQELEKAFLQVGDLLVTTGYDGIFPEDLVVGYVTQAAPLKEGAISYEIEAKLVAGNLDDVKMVNIISPILDPS